MKFIKIRCPTFTTDMNMQKIQIQQKIENAPIDFVGNIRLAH